MVPAGDPQGEVSAFGADAVEGRQHCRVARKDAAVFISRPYGDVANLPGFRLVKTGGVDELVDFAGREASDFGWRAGACEEPAGDRHGGLIARADGNDAGDQLLEYRRMAEGGEFKQGSLGKRGNRLAQPPYRHTDVERLFRPPVARFSGCFRDCHNSYWVQQMDRQT